MVNYARIWALMYCILYKNFHRRHSHKLKIFRHNHRICSTHVVVSNIVTSLPLWDFFLRASIASEFNLSHSFTVKSIFEDISKK